MKMSEFESLMNLWWSFSFSDRVENFRWERALKVELRSTFWLTRCSADWVSWRSIDRSTWRCFALKFNRSPCSWLIFFSSSSFLSKATSSCFTLFLWSSCMRSQCSLSCRVKSRWLWSSFSILMTSLSWLLTQWNSCSLMFMFHAMTAFSASTEAWMSRSETLLLTVLLSRRVVRDSTDSTSRVMMREDRSCWDKSRWEIDVLNWCFLMSENSKNFLWISDNNWVLYSKNFLQIEWWKMSVESKNFLRSKMMMQIWRISCKFFLLNRLFCIIYSSIAE